jgi:tetratricopeptide (TPR) repeat protein
MMSDIQWALAHELPPSELVPMLNKLLCHAEPGSRQAIFATRKLCELVVQTDPWRSALLAKQLLKEEPDERAWALLGLAQTLLGNYQVAAKAYRQALALAPYFPMCAHNLGHLLDVALDRPRDALSYLAQAYRAFPNEPEIGSSYAHALARAGDHAKAKAVLAKALDGDASAAEGLLGEWLSCDPPGTPKLACSERG